MRQIQEAKNIKIMKVKSKNQKWLLKQEAFWHVFYGAKGMLAENQKMQEAKSNPPMRQNAYSNKKTDLGLKVLLR